MLASCATAAATAPPGDARGSILRRAPGKILADLHCLLHDRFGLHHVPIQIEPRNFEEQRCVPLAGF